jgi:integrase
MASAFGVADTVRLLRRADLPAMRFHTLRAEGVPVKVASEMLGHADITTTLRIYSHVLPSMQEAAADAMDRLFKGAGR